MSADTQKFYQTLLRSRLPSWLERRLNVPNLALVSVERLAGGLSNESWKIVCTFVRNGSPEEMTFVIRWGLEGGVSAPYDMPGQFALLSVLAKTAIPVPEPLWLERTTLFSVNRS